MNTYIISYLTRLHNYIECLLFYGVTELAPSEKNVSLTMVNRYGLAEMARSTRAFGDSFEQKSEGAQR
jgi:hypothetical protein